MIFPGVMGEASKVVLDRIGNHYELYLNDVLVPGVISQKLVLGDNIPKVILEIAVKQYDGLTIVETE